MCVAAIAWDAHPELLLVAIGNRDEFHERPSAPLARWRDGSGIIAGRDLKAGGTWLGLSEAGRFALLTNFRDLEGLQPDRASRGGLVSGMLSGSLPDEISDMNPFNLFYADRNGAKFMTNRPQLNSKILAGGIHGLSNGSLDQPWPKTQQLCAELDDWLSGDRDDISSLFDALRTESPSPVDSAPLHAPAPDYAPVFIRNPIYGTRCSSVVVIARDGAGTIAERSFDPAGNETGERKLDFNWSNLR
jgi:uncharacterized protein with NRDE domain